MEENKGEAHNFKMPLQLQFMSFKSSEQLKKNNIVHNFRKHEKTTRVFLLQLQ